MKDIEIERGFNLVIKNARALILEAKLLFDNEHFARAYSLTQLAIEEVGKSTIICKSIFDFYMGEEITNNYFHKLGFHAHQEKIKQSLKSELFAIWMYEQSKGEKTNLRDSIIDDYNKIETYNNLKNQSLYVGIVDDRFVLPLDAITQEMALELIEKANLRLVAAEPLFRSLKEMKASAELLKEIKNNPEKEAEFIKMASEEFGINLMP